MRLSKTRTAEHSDIFGFTAFEIFGISLGIRKYFFHHFVVFLNDIVSFANVFETCYRKGGNIKDVIKNTQQIITEKMEVEMESQTIVAGAKNEQMIMTVMPIALIAIIKMMSPEFAANFATPSGIISTTIAVVMFIVAYFVGNIVLAIKI